MTPRLKGSWFSAAALISRRGKTVRTNREVAFTHVADLSILREAQRGMAIK
jgi:hypothetical protein